MKDGVALERAGLSPIQALMAATATGAEVLGIGSTHGTIAVGKTADLIMLGADPLADIRNTRSITDVIQRGRFVRR
jgi:imidazolonepropionase-like amidohydrolase